MAKDPAFLFYPNDWTGGTGLLTRHLKGCYIDLLIAQFNNGHLSLEEIRTVLGTDFSAWNTLQKKFAQDAAGKFFNGRLEAEVNKRKEYSLKQTERIKKRWAKPPSGNTTVLPLEDENRNGIGNEDKGGAGGIVVSMSNPPSQAMCENFFAGAGSTAEKGAEFFRNYNSTGWIDKNGNRVVNWTNKAQSWILRDKEKKYNYGNQRDQRREPNPHTEGMGDL